MVAPICDRAIAFSAARPRGAIRTLGFVQMDPIRAPSRAQDLILRHRVLDYRDGDLDRRYRDAPADRGLRARVRDFAEGIAPTASSAAVRAGVSRRNGAPGSCRPCLSHIRTHGTTHPRDLHRAFGAAAMVNAWGGRSAATTRSLELLHYRGDLHVSHRAQGIRIYELAPPLVRARTPRHEGLT